MLMEYPPGYILSRLHCLKNSALVGFWNLAQGLWTIRVHRNTHSWESQVLSTTRLLAPYKLKGWIVKASFSFVSPPDPTWTGCWGSEEGCQGSDRWVWGSLTGSSCGGVQLSFNHHQRISSLLDIYGLRTFHNFFFYASCSRMHRGRL